MFKRISALSGISIIMVVVSHGIKYGLWALYAWTVRYQYLLPDNFNPYIDPFHTPQWFILILGKQLSNVCVPAFFTISGFFIAYAVDKRSGNIRWETVKKRVIGLLSPFIIWTVFSIGINQVLGTTNNPIHLLLSFFGVGGFWFIPAIILIYLMAPLIIFFAQKNWKLLLFCSGFIQLITIFMKYVFFANINSPLLKLILFDNFEMLIVHNVVYFILGVVIGMNLINFKNWANRYRTSILISCIFLIAVGFYVGGTTRAYVSSVNFWNNLLLHIISRLYSFAFILTFLAYDNVKIPLSKWFTKIGSKTLGIYLTHFFFQKVFSKIIYHFFPSLLYYQLLFTLIIITVGLCGPILFMNIVRKLKVRKVYPYLFG